MIWSAFPWPITSSVCSRVVLAHRWYDPSAVTTKNGALQITLSANAEHDLDYTGQFDLKLMVSMMLI